MFVFYAESKIIYLIAQVYTMERTVCIYLLQSTPVMSKSLISNNRLSRSENLVPVLTQRSTNRQNNIFNVSLT